MLLVGAFGTFSAGLLCHTLQTQVSWDELFSVDIYPPTHAQRKLTFWLLVATTCLFNMGVLSMLSWFARDKWLFWKWLKHLHDQVHLFQEFHIRRKRLRHLGDRHIQHSRTMVHPEPIRLRILLAFKAVYKKLLYVSSDIFATFMLLVGATRNVMGSVASILIVM